MTRRSSDSPPLDQRRRVEPGQIAAEREVLLGPFPDRAQTRAEVVGHDVVGVTDEDRPVADPWEARDLLDHLGVVVGRQEGLTVAARGHRQPAHEVGHPGERRPLQLRVLVEEVVDIPRLIADHEVVLAALDGVVEHHEVVDEDLVHAPDRLERVEVVFARFGRDVRRLRGELGAQRMNPLLVLGEHGRDGVLGQPVDLEVGLQLAQLVGDGHIPLGVPETDGGGDVQRPAPSGEGTRPGPGGRWRGRWRRHWIVSVARDRTKSRMSRLARTG